MSFFDPFPTIEAAPDEPPFHYCRFNAAYLGFILGALQDSIDRPEFWSGSTAEIGEMLEKIDQLYFMLMTEVPPMAAVQTNIIHPFAWTVHTGAWSFIPSGNIPYNFGAFTSPGVLFGRLKYHAVLPAGDYNIRLVHTRYSGAGRIDIALDDSEIVGPILITDAYSAATVPIAISSATFTLTEDWEGTISATILDSPTSPGNTYGAFISELLINRDP